MKLSIQQGKCMCGWIYERFTQKFIPLMFHVLISKMGPQVSLWHLCSVQWCRNCPV